MPPGPLDPRLTGSMMHTSLPYGVVVGWVYSVNISSSYLVFSCYLKTIFFMHVFKFIEIASFMQAFKWRSGPCIPIHHLYVIHK